MESDIAEATNSDTPTAQCPAYFERPPPYPGDPDLSWQASHTASTPPTYSSLFPGSPIRNVVFLSSPPSAVSSESSASVFPRSDRRTSIPSTTQSRHVVSHPESRKCCDSCRCSVGEVWLLGLMCVFNVLVFFIVVAVIGKRFICTRL